MLRRVFFLLGLCLAGTLPAAAPSTPAVRRLPAGKASPAQRPPPEPVRPEPPPPGIERFRGSQFQFARLQTSGAYWNRHAGGDPALLDYLRRATVLKIDPVFHSVRADSVEALIVYPFIYCDNISYLSRAEAANVAEYLRRGGFLCIDACEFRTINPSIPLFLEAQLAVLKGQFPNLRTEELLPEHEIFSVYFKLKNAPPYRKARDVLHPTYAVYDGDRLIGLIGLNGMQCGWSDDSAASYSTECGQMMANIYVYAMTR
ncbi:MAG: DUF4159 domain-containing protein [Opitutaceae bacterium]